MVRLTSPCTRLPAAGCTCLDRLTPMTTYKPAREFVEQACTRCGLCFSKCPVMDLSVKQARDEIRRLIAGEPSRQVLQKCTSCFACDTICPEGCNPCELVLQRWHETYRTRGLPVRARHYSPHEALNFRTYVVSRMPREERERIRRWEDLTPVDEILYPGCNIITASFLTRTRALEGLEIRGGLDYCCGETYYRMGLFEEVARVAKRLERYFKTLRVKRVNILCTAGCNMFLNVLPSFGVDFDFEVRPYLPVILEKLESGELPVTHPLEGTVTIQESCYGKIFGDSYMDVPRRILEVLGLEVIEQKKTRSRALCCGIAGGFSPTSGYHISDVTRGHREKPVASSEYRGRFDRDILCRLSADACRGKAALPCGNARAPHPGENLNRARRGAGSPRVPKVHGFPDRNGPAPTAFDPVPEPIPGAGNFRGPARCELLNRRRWAA